MTEEENDHDPFDVAMHEIGEIGKEMNANPQGGRFPIYAIHSNNAFCLGYGMFLTHKACAEFIRRNTTSFDKRAEPREFTYENDGGLRTVLEFVSAIGSGNGKPIERYAQNGS